jgi:hypothetical protein
MIIFTITKSNPIMSLENNPIAEEVIGFITEYLYNDIEKSDIKSVVKEVYPHFNDEVFELCFTEAFTNL